jgi:hypothetical protein
MVDHSTSVPWRFAIGVVLQSALLGGDPPEFCSSTEVGLNVIGCSTMSL